MNLGQKLDLLFKINHPTSQVSDVYGGEPICKLLLRTQMAPHVDHNPGDFGIDVKADRAITLIPHSSAAWF